MTSKPNSEKVTALVLQGGGALGAYQAGVYEKLAANSYQPDWIAGISIGAINAAIIAGNPQETRVEKLRAFWEGTTAGLQGHPLWFGEGWRSLHSQLASAFTLFSGVPGFFTPRVPPPNLAFTRSPGALSFYDTTPLKKTLEDLVDFDLLNDRGPQLSVGAVDVETGNFAYFDSSAMTIGPEHIMASGALPPGFAPVVIDGRAYWDGGLVSNTPLQYVLENAKQCTITIFQVDLFSARGNIPTNIAEVAQRQKDIQYSSRTRLTTDRFRELAAISEAAERLAKKLPASLQNDPDLTTLRMVCPADQVKLVHLIHRRQHFESQSKDYEFSRLSMREHWADGAKDVEKTLQHREWRNAKPHPGIQVFDLTTSKDAKPRSRKEIA